MILSAAKLQKEFSAKAVLHNITFHLEEKEKMALIGVNGAGKTTLFRILLGQLAPDGGQLFIQKNARLGYLPQVAEYTSSHRIYDELNEVFAPLRRLEAEIRTLEHTMASDASPELMERYARLQDEFEKQEGYSAESRLRGVLKGLGFAESEYELPVSSLSGGQKSRVMLGKLLLMQPDILLLDEPTNHLDIESTQWLESYLAAFPGAAIIISHDRYFLDRLCTKTMEIERGVSTVYNGNYSYYLTEKAAREKAALREYEAQQAEIRRQEEIAARLRSYNTEMFIKRAQSREKILEKMEVLDKPASLDASMRLHFTPQIRSADIVASAQKLGKAFGPHTLFSNVDFEIRRGERVALIGANGIGKTTLFKMLMGELPPSSGELRLGVKVYPGYYDQTQESLHDDKSILDEIYDTYPTMTLSQIRRVLGSFLFRGDEVFKQIGVLSGGERARVSLCKIMLGQANFLLFDEPTNHLDIISREILENNLISYEGTIFFISHDRYFINRVATRIVELTPTGMENYLGNYDFYLDHKKAKAQELQRSTEPTAVKESFLQQKQSSSELRKKKTRIRQLESQIEKAEARIREIEEQMLQPEFYNAPLVFRELEKEKAELEASIETSMEKWDSLSSELDA